MSNLTFLLTFLVFNSDHDSTIFVAFQWKHKPVERVDRPIDLFRHAAHRFSRIGTFLNNFAPFIRVDIPGFGCPRTQRNFDFWASCWLKIVRIKKEKLLPTIYGLEISFIYETLKFISKKITKKCYLVSSR